MQTKLFSPGRLLLALIALPLALGLAACGKKDDAPAAGPVGGPLAAVAPPAGKAWTDIVAVTPDGGYVMGNPNAPIKVVEFGSLTCPHCAEFAEKGFPRLREDYVAKGTVSLEFRNFVRDPYDTTMAMLVRCGSPESFFALTEQVYANQKDIFDKLQPIGAQLQAENLPPNQMFKAIGERGGLTDFFAARGIAKDQAMQCLAKSESATKLVNDTSKAGDTYNVTGTPTFLVNGRNVEVATWEALEPILKQAGAR
ncbi:MAG: thioredoxin domain-containing protein [Novosphingobium sp.]|uniref:thioredoxin domain-containing protein n=1 Tax=Novosphingobium sp. TaxID=1874826 RepID=UPI003018291D